MIANTKTVYDYCKKMIDNKIKCLFLKGRNINNPNLIFNIKIENNLMGNLIIVATDHEKRIYTQNIDYNNCVKILAADFDIID